MFASRKNQYEKGAAETATVNVTNRRGLARSLSSRPIYALTAGAQP